MVTVVNMWNSLPSSITIIENSKIFKLKLLNKNIQKFYLYSTRLTAKRCLLPLALLLGLVEKGQIVKQNSRSTIINLQLSLLPKIDLLN